VFSMCTNNVSQSSRMSKIRQHKSNRSRSRSRLGMCLNIEVMTTTQRFWYPVKSENHAAILSLNLLFCVENAWLCKIYILVNADFGESSTITEQFSTKCFRSKEDKKYSQQRTLFFCMFTSTPTLLGS